MSSGLVSAVIPTYNRFTYLLNAIGSIKNQTYPNIEIIVVNDCSTQREYYEYDWEKERVKFITLKENSKKIFGFACAAFVRNKGIEESKGVYIAFCDDDDIWLPKKIELQIDAMNTTNCKMSSTEGYIGEGIFDKNKVYKKYISESSFSILRKKYRNKGVRLSKNFPDIWDLDFLKIHNCMICSSVIVKKELLERINNIRCIKNGEEDYDCWKRLLEYTESVYVKEPCFYYDQNHGDGQNY